ncbi:lipase esterase family protein [Microthyrium microscopicum]|uniref:Lipase esterase family protein n=1 Tax=Microthyrium microscopicum TaxID=703497 RepID=A0A6A6TYQ5_9PEZI|nr:lipase esterase family protein [Microthyrium microscopicum]
MGKYSHYSDADPEFAPIQNDVAKMIDEVFALPLDQMRNAFSQPGPLPEDSPKDVTTKDMEISVRDGSKIGIRIYKRKGLGADALLFLVLHGGGWVIGNHSTEETMNRYVAGLNDAVVVSVDYRMAPEFRYPHAANDSFDALKWCAANASTLGISANRIVVGGSSAGGNLSAVVAQMARDNGVPGILGQVLNIPVTCHPDFFPRDRYEYNSWTQNENAPLLPSRRMALFWDYYVPKGQLRPEAYHSPLLAKNLKGLPPALVQVAGMDPLRDEGIAYADALKEAGVDVKLEVYGGVPHGFGSMPNLSKSVKYNQNVVDFIKKVDQDKSKL